MKRPLMVAAVLLVATAAVGAGLAWTKPEMMPEWARFPSAKAEPAADAGLFCKEHGVPEKFCTICHEELKSTLMLCKEHGDIPEDICTLCHPEVEAKYGLVMCKEHGLPESFCAKCGNGPSASTAGVPDDGWCALHNQPEPLCLDCADDPRPIGPLVGGEEPRECRRPLPIVRLASTKLVRQVGFQTAPARADRHSHTLTANAEIAYNANAYAEVSPRVEGFLREVTADLGREVRPGERLATVDAASVGAGKSQYLAASAALKLAKVNFERTATLVQSQAVPAKSELEDLTTYNQAEAALFDAEQRLRNLGFSDSQLAHIVAERDTGSELDVTSPIQGVVVARHAVQGEAVKPDTRLFAVADTTKMWLWIDVYEGEVSRVRPGQEVTFAITGARATEPVSRGRVTWVGTEVDDKTRTTRVRAELENPGGRLRANVFGIAEITVEDPHEVVVIPSSAVQEKDGAPVVFLPVEAGLYRPQRIIARPTQRPGLVEVAWGLKPGDEVVTDGSFWLKTEIEKGSIGAGCCE